MHTIEARQDRLKRQYYGLDIHTILLSVYYFCLNSLKYNIYIFFLNTFIIIIMNDFRDDIISVNELVLAIRRIQKVSDDTRLQRIAEILEKMDVDHDGAVEVDHVLKVSS